MAPDRRLIHLRHGAASDAVSPTIIKFYTV
jgi:hypothetical protein